MKKALELFFMITVKSCGNKHKRIKVYIPKDIDGF